jgi:aspartyl aminopeptidase
MNAESSADPAVQDLITYLDSSPSPYHAVETAAQRLRAAGFAELSETAPWGSEIATAAWFVRRGGALIAWRAPAESGSWINGVHIIGAHTDSPNLRVKPSADTSSAGYNQVGVEVYGGVLNNSWLDRDLGISGRLVLASGDSKLVRSDRPLGRVAQLAIHLDREVNEKGLILDKQLHLLPFVGLTSSEADAPTFDFVGFVAREHGVEPSQVVAHDLMFHDLTPAVTLGVNNEFIASARIDNLFSCWAAVAAITQTSAGSHGQIVALFDHEEVGSSSTTGAAGPLLERVLQRLFAAALLGPDAQAVAVARSSCVSSDMAHAVHPNYSDRHEPQHRPIPNGGPVIKSNANQRYASTPDTSALFASACAAAGVPSQFFVSKNSMPCGSTIGPITATRLGIDTVDVGCAMLSMHSARELCGATDASFMLRALSSYLQQ